MPKGVYIPSRETVEKRAAKLRGRKRPPFSESWKKNMGLAQIKKNPKYRAIHSWIQKINGKAHHCQNRVRKILPFVCTRISNRFEWAKRKGRDYSRNKKDYVQLCKSCHSKYDKND